MFNSTQYKLKIVLFLLFILSGFSGLIYESIWTHYIKLILGHAAYAQTLVLSIFMGGLAIGAAFTARKNLVLKMPLRTYAMVEFAIGLLALTFHAVFIFTESLLHETLIPSIDSPALIEFVRWSVAAILILPQSILLGTTFPLLGTAIIRMDSQQSGSTLAMLYFTNSIGAAIGVLVSAFLLIALVGLPGTILTAGLINIFIAIVVWVLSKHEPSYTRTQAQAASSATGHNGKDKFARWLLAVALLTGLASFFYEIAWIRMLSLVLGSSMQAFELMLSAFIAGLALGGLWIHRRIEKIQNPALFLGKIQLIMALCAVATLPLYHEMFDLMSFLIRSLTKTESGYLLFNLGSHVISLLIMLPATFMAGMTLPLITFTLLQWNQAEASIGRVYAANTVGAILGILLAVHIAMPVIGTKGLILSGAVIDLALGLFLILRNGESKRSSRRLALASALVVSVIAFGTEFDGLRLASGVFRYGEASSGTGAKMLYYQNGKTASISVVETATGIKSIATNGKSDAAIYPAGGDYGVDEITMTMLAALPLAVHPQAKTLANIGLGSGLTTHTLLLSPQLSRIDTIEIESAVVAAVSQFGTATENALLDPRSTIIIADAKAFFSRNKLRYDIIVSEPSNPWVAGVSGLFSSEFYHHIKSFLNDDGILVQWLHLYETNLDLVASVFNALAANFEDYAVYSTANDDIIIVASDGRDPSRLDDRLFATAALRQQLSRVHIVGIDDIHARLLGNKALLQPFFAALDVPANSDYFPTLGLYATKSRFLQQSATELSELHISDFPPVQLIRPIVSNAASALYFMGDAAKRRARIISKLLTQAETEPLPTTMPDDDFFMDMQEKVAVVRALLASCESLANRRQLFGNSLHTIAINTLPFLATDEMRSFWEQLGSHPCLQSWPVEIQQWARLYAAIGLNQHGQTVMLAQAIMQDSIGSASPQLSFLMGASLSAYMKMGRHEEAREFASRAIELANGEMQFPLYLRILFAQLDSSG